MTNKLKPLIDAYSSITEQGQDIVLATVIETFGSTYQKSGARMMITQEGALIGLLGGGCFESDLVQQAQTVFDTGQTKTVFYDMRSPKEVIWDLGLGCNGAIRVCLQRLRANNHYYPLNQIMKAIEQNEPGIWISIYDSEICDFASSYNIFLLKSTLSSSQDIFYQSALKTANLKVCQREIHYVNEKSIHVFYDFIEPPLQLLILGAGVDTKPLVDFAKLLGWRVTLVDYRPHYIQRASAFHADTLLEILPDELGNALDLTQFSAVILMTHNMEYDKRYLYAIADCIIPFIGLLGPAHRKERLLQTLGNDAQKIQSRVFAPIGLDIGAQTPEEIALSIISGIQAYLHGREGGQLSHKK
jgi:xanthine dehydrogenase accessory factor